MTRQDSISFTVQGLPPKKDGANAMWGKAAEIPRIKNLRIAAVKAMDGHPPFEAKLYLKIEIHADSLQGDLDNFITGICDGLMAAHKNFRANDSNWEDLPTLAQPNQSIMFLDDKQITKIEAERLPTSDDSQSYTIQVRVM